MDTRSEVYCRRITNKPSPRCQPGLFFPRVSTDYELSVAPALVGFSDVGVLYTAAGLAGPLGCLMSFFFGFFFSRPRVSRLPMTCSSDDEMRSQVPATTLGLYFSRKIFARGA
jgi:hypothetical protein